MSAITSRVLLLAALVAIVLCLTNAFAEAKPSRAEKALLEKRKKHGGDSFSGVATWFIPSTEGGSMGACGDYEDDDDYIVALNSEQYGSMKKVSEHCGKRVRITHDGNSVEATINDACPECEYGDLDLTMPVFEELGKAKTGVLDIEWEFI